VTGIGATPDAGGTGRIADQSGSPRPSRGISPTVPLLGRMYNGDGAQAPTRQVTPISPTKMKFVRAMIAAACYTAQR
jgi:hypothetical protein